MIVEFATILAILKPFIKPAAVVGIGYASYLGVDKLMKRFQEGTQRARERQHALNQDRNKEVHAAQMHAIDQEHQETMQVLQLNKRELQEDIGNLKIRLEELKTKNDLMEQK